MAVKQIVLKVTAKGAKAAGQVLKGVSNTVTNLGKAAAITGAAFAAFSLKLAGDFQKNLLEVSTLMDKGSFNIKKMSSELRNAAGASGLALSSLSKAKYDIVSAGFSSASQSAQVLNTSMELAVGGVTSAAEAADLLSSAINAYGLSSEDSQKISDSLFTTVRQGKTTINELAQSLGQVLPFAKSMKLDIDGVGAAMATLTAAGVNTAESTTALKGTITALTSPGQAAKKAMDEAGISVKRFGDGSVDLFETMKQFENVEPELLSKFIPDKRAQLGVQAMAGNIVRLKSNIDAFEDAATNVDKFGNEISETTQAFDKMQGAFNTQMARLKNNAQSGMIAVGDMIIKVIGPKIAAVNKLFEKIGNIGWDVVGERMKESGDTIMRVLKLTIDHGLNLIRANVKVVALQIAQELNHAIMPKMLQTDFTERIAEATKSAEEITATSVSSIKGMYTSLFALLTREKQAETESFAEGEESKLPPIKKVTHLIGAQGEKVVDLTSKENAHFQTTFSGIRNSIKGYYAQLIAKSLIGEASKGPMGIITGGLVAAGFASLFDSVVPKFAQGGIVPGSGGGDTVPAMLTPGELILNQAQQEKVAGGMGGVTVNITAPLVDDHIIDVLIPAINDAVYSNKARLTSTTSRLS